MDMLATEIAATTATKAHNTTERRVQTDSKVQLLLNITLEYKVNKIRKKIHPKPLVPGGVGE